MAAALPRAYALPIPRPARLAWPWAYAVEGSRDLRLDLLRGFCVFAMVVDHVGGASFAHAVSGAGAAGLWLLGRGRTGWLLAGSGALWLSYQLNAGWAVNLPWPIANNTMFHFPAWQVYFVAAMALGYHRQKVTRWLANVPKGPL